MSDTYSTPGTYTWTAPSNGTVDAECWGGGGGGNAEGGGGGGAYSEKLSIAVSSGVGYTVTVGSGGDAYFTGEDSWFSSAGTVLAKGGETGSDGEFTNGFGGQAGSGVGDTKYSGGDGYADGAEGGGGSSAGTAAAGNSASSTAGASAPTGGGAGGAGDFFGTAVNGTAPGGGGGGSAGGTPGAGGAGKVVLTFTAGGGGGGTVGPVLFHAHYMAQGMR